MNALSVTAVSYDHRIQKLWPDGEHICLTLWGNVCKAAMADSFVVLRRWWHMSWELFCKVPPICGYRLGQPSIVAAGFCLGSFSVIGY